MRVSKSEAARIPAVSNTILKKNGRDPFQFKEIMPDSLPVATTESDPMEIARIMKIVNQTPDIREDLVLDLKDQLSRDEYNVEGVDIAEMMIRRMKADKVR
ncbi:MAG: flagellar biosynthesis anti-sigma factor FlgM [Armatimonadota bacterium]